MHSNMWEKVCGGEGSSYQGYMLKKAMLEYIVNIMYTSFFFLDPPVLLIEAVSTIGECFSK